MARRARFPRDFLAGTVKSWRQVRNFLVTSPRTRQTRKLQGSRNGNWANRARSRYQRPNDSCSLRTTLVACWRPAHVYCMHYGCCGAMEYQSLLASMNDIFRSTCSHRRRSRGGGQRGQFPPPPTCRQGGTVSNAPSPFRRLSAMMLASTKKT